MATINNNYQKLSAGYLFPEIARRTKAFQESHPGVKVYRLGIGNTTEPITPYVLEGLRHGVEKLGKVETYSGYGDEQGDSRLRSAIAENYAKHLIVLNPSEIFVSVGAKPDTANIQSLFSLDNLVAVQDPSYPVYVDTNVIAGRGGDFNKEIGQYDNILYMPCTEQNGFIPNIPNKFLWKQNGVRFLCNPDLIYLCSPNNPTGAVMNRTSLEKFVEKAKEDKAVIIFDAAYSWFVSDKELPKSIYEIEGAEEVAIEINSFSKISGFTGVRLGWTVVPNQLVAENVDPGVLNNMWNRRQTTFFNGASNIAQEGGLFALSPEGIIESKRLVDYYMTN